MTITSTTQSVQGNGNDSATVFSFSDMTIFDEDDLTVTHVTSAGVETVLTRGTGTTNYSVTLTTPAFLPSTGSITYPATLGTELATNDYLIIKREMDLLQGTDLENRGGYFPEVQEQAFDEARMVDIQQQEELDRTLKGPIGFTGTFGTLDTPVADLYVRRNSDNDGYEHSALVTGITAAGASVEDTSNSSGAAGSSDDYSRKDHVHLSGLVAGNTTFTGNNTFSGDTTIDHLVQGVGTTAASASTLALAGDGVIYTVSGTSTITAVTGVVAGEVIFLVASAGWTITDDGDNIIIDPVSGSSYGMGTGQVSEWYAHADNKITFVGGHPLFGGQGTHETGTNNALAATPGRIGYSPFVKPVIESAVATTSGTSVTLASSLPTDVDRVEIIFKGVEHGTADTIGLLQIGPTAGVLTSGYISYVYGHQGSTTTLEARTDGFGITSDVCWDAGLGIWGTVWLTHVGGDEWHQTGSITHEANGFSNGAGWIDTGGSLEDIVFTTVGGATFSAGSIIVRYYRRS